VTNYKTSIAYNHKKRR